MERPDDPIPFLQGRFVVIERTIDGAVKYGKIIHEAEHIGGHTQALGVEVIGADTHKTIQLDHLIRLNPNGALLELPKE